MRCRFMAFAFVLAAFLSGCSHWFLDSESRLQVENATEDCTLLALDIVSEDGKSFEPWLHETVLPGERSHVVSGDWVGEFKVRVLYAPMERASAKPQVDVRTLEFEGGSLYLVVGGQRDSLTYRFR